jgi:subtilisin family serine protease
MRRLAVLIPAAALAVGACNDQPVAPPDHAAPTFSVSGSTGGPGTYLVRFKGSGVPAGFESSVAALGAEVIFAHEVGIAAVAGLSDAGADQLAAIGGVAAVDADAFVALEEPAELAPDAADAVIESAANPTTAFFYPRQWHMRAIRANAAWAAGKLGSPGIKVGILDTGIDYISPDLVGRIDLSLSKSFLSAAENARVQAAFPGAHEVADVHYHGTHVASTVASNGLVAAGVTSGVTLVGLKVCAPGVAPSWRGTCPTSGTLAAILYAADNGIPIVNMSLGGAFQRSAVSARGGDAPSFLATINRVFNYAMTRGTTIIVSAGNDRLDLERNRVPSGTERVLVPDLYASYCDAPATICVSATGPTSAAGVNGPWTNIDALATYSNYGRGAIDVAAPGGSSGGSVWATCSRFSLAIPVCRTGNFAVGVSGTSMAAPHTTGVAALIASGGTIDPAGVRARLMQSADDLGQPGTDPVYGSGRINAGRAAGAL